MSCAVRPNPNPNIFVLQCSHPPQSPNPNPAALPDRSDLKPWLVEVNASPSLSVTTEADRVLKLSLLRDTFNIVAAGVPSVISESAKTLGTESVRSAPCQPLGGFYVLYDEAAEGAELGGRDEEEERARGKGRATKGKVEWR